MRATKAGVGRAAAWHIVGFADIAKNKVGIDRSIMLRGAGAGGVVKSVWASSIASIFLLTILVVWRPSPQSSPIGFIIDVH